MNLSKILLVSLLSFKSISQVSSFDPITVTLLGTLLTSLYYVSQVDEHKTVTNTVKNTVRYIGQKIGYYEGCESYWIPGNLRALQNDLQENVFGQQVAMDLILTSLKIHLEHNQPERPLVLSFHGSPGTGKNFISQKILQHMFRRGEKTEFKYFFKSSIDFPLKTEIYSYKKLIIDIVKEKNYQCRRSVFVFDEVEKMPDGILDVLTGIVSAGHNEDYDFRKSIFILLSNIGSEVLYNEALYLLQNNIPRENLNTAKMHSRLSQASFNENGGLKKTGLIRNHVISYHVPFLPLETSHVIECLEREVAKQGQIMSGELIAQILEELLFIPDDTRIFSHGGCKGVGEKAGMFFEREKYRKRRYNQHEL